MQISGSIPLWQVKPIVNCLQQTTFQALQSQWFWFGVPRPPPCPDPFLCCNDARWQHDLLWIKILCGRFSADPIRTVYLKCEPTDRQYTVWWHSMKFMCTVVGQLAGQTIHTLQSTFEGCHYFDRQTKWWTCLARITPKSSWRAPAGSSSTGRYLLRLQVVTSDVLTKWSIDLIFIGQALSIAIKTFPPQF